MCVVPAVATMAGLSIAAQVANTAAQRNAAFDQAKYQNDQYTEISNAASSSYNRQVSVLANQLVQQNEVQSQNAQASSLAIEQARSASVVSAGERGVAGNSINTLLSDFSRQEAQNNFALKTNQAWMQSQFGEQAAGLRAEAQSRISGAVPQPVASPSGAGLALQVGSTLFSAYDKQLQLTRQGPYNPNGSPNSNASAWYKPLFSS